jgi:O-acetyl-ADP-ribose deacetylase (regulator of RNase III)
MIHEKAGPELLKARQGIGSIDVGCAAITPAFDLHAKYVIHTVGPVWEGGSYGEEMLLRNCYDNSLKLALEGGCESIAFPLISTGNYGFPKDKALQIAIAAFSEFLLEQEMQIYLVVFDQASFKLSEKLFQSVASYIDEYYVDSHDFTYGTLDENRRRIRRRREMEICECTEALEEMPMVGAVEGLHPCATMATSKAMSLEDMLKQTDAGFAETLLKLIDKTGKKDSEIYNRANVSRQHFSKIRNNPAYKPTKPTALAFAIALELDLEQTKDLIGRAGYALTNSSKFDVIVRFFIESGNYNMMEINTALFEFDQSLLGSQTG